jgi:hypothetical protein
MVEFNLRIKKVAGLPQVWHKAWVYIVVLYGERQLWNSSNSQVTKGEACWPETGPDCPSYIFDTEEIQTKGSSGFGLGTIFEQPFLLARIQEVCLLNEAFDTGRQ